MNLWYNILVEIVTVYMGGFTLSNVGEFRDTFYFLSDSLNQNDLLCYCSDSISSYVHRL